LEFLCEALGDIEMEAKAFTGIRDPQCVCSGKVGSIRLNNINTLKLLQLQNYFKLKMNGQEIAPNEDCSIMIENGDGFFGPYGIEHEKAMLECFIRLANGEHLAYDELFHIEDFEFVTALNELYGVSNQQVWYGAENKQLLIGSGPEQQKVDLINGDTRNRASKRLRTSDIWNAFGEVLILEKQIGNNTIYVNIGPLISWNFWTKFGTEMTINFGAAPLKGWHSTFKLSL
jgi:hypothetical protein